MNHYIKRPVEPAPPYLEVAILVILFVVIIKIVMTLIK